jgi:4-hydroxy-tetrahydrodipicolinate synthase
MARGDLAEARRLEARLAPVIHAAFVESNPIPVKAMLHLQQRALNVLRLPLVALSDVHHETVRRALVDANAL